MNSYESEANGTMVNDTPLFASVWLAFFYVLRRSFNERRVTAVASRSETSRVKTK